MGPVPLGVRRRAGGTSTIEAHRKGNINYLAQEISF